ncbi:serine/threonine-protein kinase [Occallatibacter savannae]|uniref:serine/threonine-protein kinase n=1 Tax=Occallatibacter savannae TaxID=1002691 RepID=UPI000D69A2DB|nr:serine/threonine-protein kinase [Occallatibacter savannae]
MPVLKTSFSEGELIAGNYRVLSVAGSGGMGVVYKARDERLGRTVALKFLPADLNASEKDKERFLREARTASSLDDPNIGVIHGIDETEDGLTFIVMAFYDGASLAQRIAKGRLGNHQAIGILRQMALGLGEAHSRGIIHRDVKPSNVMLTSSGVVKIVDFGLARAMSEATASQTGVTGTVRYMSPEQAMDRTLDQRCDIWAVGVVFAEMLTGTSPFHAESLTAMLFAILNEPPKGVEAVHPALQPILYRALAKDPEKRYGSCKELLSDLDQAAKAVPEDAADGEATQKLPATMPGGRTNAQTKRLIAEASRGAWGPANSGAGPITKGLFGALALLLVVGLVMVLVRPLREKVLALLTGAPSEKHVAVLPFDNIGSNPENAALADGLMESLAGRLTNLDVGNKALWIVPTSEVRRQHVTDPADALKNLGANLVIKGAVERDGNDIHLTVNLIDTKNMRQMGSAMLEDPAGDLSTLEDEAISRLAKLMNITVTADMLRNTGGRVNPAAYEEYLTALGLMQRYDKPGNLDQAISALEGAVKADPGFALGYAQIGEAYRVKSIVEQNQRWLVQAEANARKAVELDNRIPSVYVTLGRMHDTAGKHDLALEEFKHALQLDPRNATAMAGMGRAYELAGRVNDAEASFRKAADLQPNDWDAHNNLAMFYDRQSKYSESIAEFKRALELAPDSAQVLFNLGATYVDSGDPKYFADAESALKRSIAINPSFPAFANLGALYDREGKYQQASEMTQKALEMNAENYIVWGNLRLDYEWLKQPEKEAEARRREISLVEEAIQQKPRDAEAYAQLANLSAEEGQREKALANLRTAIALSPNDPAVLDLGADTYEKLGDRKQAIEYLGKALKAGYTKDELIADPELQDALADPAVKALLK